MLHLFLLFFSLPIFGTQDLINNITVIGIGRLGLCTALSFEKAGYNVLGLDINQNYVESLNNKSFKSKEPQVEEYLKNSKNFRATCSFNEATSFSNIYYIMVDTPSTNSKEAYDHSKLSKVLTEINNYKVKNKHIVIGCTIFPGYIRTIGKFLIRDCENTTLSYNPEFIAQGDIIRGLQNPDMVLIGQGSKEAGDILESIYNKVCLNKPQICKMSADSAEITKLAINCFITTKIAYANFIGDIADKTPDANKFEILKAAGADKRIGHLYLRPGYGFGGPCFPRDNRALGSYAAQLNIEPVLSQATDFSNILHREFMVEQLLLENKSEYIFEKVAYKENCPVPIIEESQKLLIAADLAKAGKKVIIVDREDIIILVQQAYGNIFEYCIV